MNAQLYIEVPADSRENGHSTVASMAAKYEQLAHVEYGKNTLIGDLNGDTYARLAEQAHSRAANYHKAVCLWYITGAGWVFVYPNIF